MNLPLHQAQEYWENHPKVKEFNDKAGKHVADQYEKYNMGLKTQSQALKNVSDELGIHFTKAEELWAEHKNKAEADSREKQKTADKIFADGKKQGLKYSEIASKIKKTLGYPANVIKYVDNAEKNHDKAKLDSAYETFKKANYQGIDDIGIANQLQSRHGYSYDDSWEALDKLKNHHEKKSKDHFDIAKEIVLKNKSASYGDHVDNVGKELGLNMYDAEQMTSRVKTHIKNEQKKVAMSVYKKIMSWGGGADEAIDHIASTLDVDKHQATKLFNIAKNSTPAGGLGGLPDPETDTAMGDLLNKGTTYDDLKNKTTEHTGGAKIYHNHDLDTSEPEPEHIKRYKSKVEVAERVDAHDAFDKHVHLVHPHSDGFYNLDSKTKAMSNAVREYTGSTYQEINSGLRKGGLYDFLKDTVKNMDNAFKHKSAKTVKDTMVYRGYTNKIVNNLEPGDVFEDKGFMSTTALKHKAESWAASDSTVMHILLPKGSNALTVQHLSNYSNESEVLLNRGAKIRVIKKEPRKNSYGEVSGYTIYAEYLPEDSHTHMKKSKKKVDKSE